MHIILAVLVPQERSEKKSNLLYVPYTAKCICKYYTNNIVICKGEAGMMAQYSVRTIDRCKYNAGPLLTCNLPMRSRQSRA